MACEVSALHPVDSVKCIGQQIVDGVGDAISSAFSTVFGGFVEWLTGLITDAVGTVVKTLGTFWVNVPSISVGDMAGNPSSVVGWLVSRLGWYTVTLAVVSILVGAGRMALTRKADPGVDTARSFVQFICVCGFGIAVIAASTEAADQFSNWIIGDSTGDNFGANLTELLAFASVSGGFLIVVILGIIAVLASCIQIILMLMRSVVLILLAGFLPTAAAATNTEMGKQQFQKIVAWIVAFILYKPVASIIYALAFRLIGDQSINSGDGLIKVLAGVTLMLLALFALPALMKLAVPATASVAGKVSAGMMAAGAVGAVATGAVMVATGGAGAAAGAGAGAAGGGASGAGLAGGSAGGGGGALGGAAGGGGGGPTGGGGGGGSSDTGPSGSAMGTGSTSSEGAGGNSSSGGGSGSGAVDAATTPATGSSSGDVDDAGGSGGGGGSGVATGSTSQTGGSTSTNDSSSGSSSSSTSSSSNRQATSAGASGANQWANTARQFVDRRPSRNGDSRLNDELDSDDQPRGARI